MTNEETYDEIAQQLFAIGWRSPNDAQWKGLKKWWGAKQAALSPQQAAVDVFGPIFKEIEKAVRKFPTWPTDPLHALAVLGEEFGELTKSTLQMAYEPHKTSVEEMRTEAIQTAAMALRFYISLETYVHTKSEQHAQGLLKGGNGQ